MAGRRISGVLLDANLLCLLVVGSSRLSSVLDHPRLRAFDVSDYRALIQILDRFGDLVLSPHVIAETSNLIAYRQSEAQRVALRRSLARVITVADEQSRAAKLTTADAGYERLGVTDAILLLLADAEEVLLVSDDLGLCLEAARRGLRVVNYNNLRDGALRLDQIG